jgi:hypothetical protein
LAHVRSLATLAGSAVPRPDAQMLAEHGVVVEWFSRSSRSLRLGTVPQLRKLWQATK